MLLELEGLEERVAPADLTPTVPALIAEMNAIVGFVNAANQLIQNTFPPTSGNLVFLLAGLQATAQLDAQFSQAFAQWLPDMSAAILAAAQ